MDATVTNPGKMSGGGARRRLEELRATVLGLQTKATVLVVALLVLIAASLCSLAVEAAWRLTNRLVSEEVLLRAELIARFSADELHRGDIDRLRHILSELVETSPLLAVQVTDESGNLIVAAGAPVFAERDASARWETAGTLVGTPRNVMLPGGAGTILQVCYPITSHSPNRDVDAYASPRLLGYVQLGVDRARTVNEFQAAVDLVIGIGIAVVLLSIPTGFFLVRRIVAPLNEMSDMARRFSAGDLRARSRVRRSDEIGVLAASLNDMAEEIARKHGEILTLNNELEERVMERTAQLRELASREPLTGLYNRRHFSETLVRRLSEAKRYGTELSLLMTDMDDFKTVNDSYGHQVGDELLMLAARTISRQLRAADVAARYGGDEFMILMPHSDASQAQTLAGRIIDHFHAECRAKYPHIRISLSVGIASITECNASTDDQFIRAADRALYEAKSLGKNRIVHGTPVGQ